MDVFDLRARLVEDYARYTRSLVNHECRFSTES